MSKRPFLAVDIDGATMHCAAVASSELDWASYQFLSVDRQIENCLAGVEASIRQANTKQWPLISNAPRGGHRVALSLPDRLFQHHRISLPVELLAKKMNAQLQAQLQAECEVRFGADALFTAVPAHLSTAVTELSYDLLAIPRTSFADWQRLFAEQWQAKIVSIEPRSWALQRCGYRLLADLDFGEATSVAASTSASAKPKAGMVVFVDAEQTLLLKIADHHMTRAVVNGGFGIQAEADEVASAVDINKEALDDSQPGSVANDQDDMVVRNVLRHMVQMHQADMTQMHQADTTQMHRPAQVDQTETSPTVDYLADNETTSAAMDETANAATNKVTNQATIYCVAPEAAYTALLPHFRRLNINHVVHEPLIEMPVWQPVLAGLARVQLV